MIIFHEGLPGSGKSYEAAINRIIPALKANRQVFAYIEGLNHEKFSEITGLSLDKLTGKTEYQVITVDQYSKLNDEQKALVVKDKGMWSIKVFTGLLHQLSKDQVKTIYQHVANDSLVIIDELQDFFPPSMRKLDDGITSFVTQHRHRGIDIVVMGQDHRDCHSLWKRRVDQLYNFVKRDAIGQAHRYTWKSYKLNEGKLIKLRSGSGEYDKKYFGLYASHTDSTENTDTYKDDRANVLKSAGFKYGIPVALLAAGVAVYYLVGVFKGDHSMVSVAKSQTAINQPSNPVQQPQTILAKTNAHPQEKTPKAVPRALNYQEYIDQIVTQYKPRLAAIISNTNKVVAKVDFLDDTFHVKESLNLVQLSALGWQYAVQPYGLLLVKGTQNIVVTAWPIDVIGRVSNTTSNSL